MVAYPFPKEETTVTSSDLISIVGKKYSSEILEAADEAKSAEEISNEADVPIGTAYRRINDLTDVGLLSHEGEILTEERRRKSVYRRNISTINIVFNQRSISVTVEERDKVENKLDDAWRTLSK